MDNHSTSPTEFQKEHLNQLTRAYFAFDYETRADRMRDKLVELHTDVLYVEWLEEDGCYKADFFSYAAHVEIYLRLCVGFTTIGYDAQTVWFTDPSEDEPPLPRAETAVR